ncbi:MAG: AAC(3) family N-acetyltransferase [Caldilineaceae bacterium]
MRQLFSLRILPTGSFVCTAHSALLDMWRAARQLKWWMPFSGRLYAAGSRFHGGSPCHPSSSKKFVQNGWDYDNYRGPSAGIGRIFSPNTKEIDKEMGAITAAVLNPFERSARQSSHLLIYGGRSLARRLMRDQCGDNVYAPLAALAELDGIVVLAGVSLDKMTLIHLAEKRAGRNLFRRFANDPSGQSAAVEVGGCSDGFAKLAEPLRALRLTAQIGQSLWPSSPPAKHSPLPPPPFKQKSWITHCGRADCDRCNDAVKGGPVAG